MRYIRLFAALTAAVLLCGCSPVPAEDPSANAPDLTAATEAAPLEHAALTNIARVEDVPLPEGCFYWEAKRMGDGVAFADETGVTVFSPSLETQRIELVPLALREGQMLEGVLYAYEGDSIYTLTILADHGGLDPEHPDENDPSFWEKYEDQRVAEYYLCTYAADGTLVDKVLLTGMSAFENASHEIEPASLTVVGGTALLVFQTGRVCRLDKDGSVTEITPPVEDADHCAFTELLLDRDGAPLYYSLWEDDRGEGIVGTHRLNAYDPATGAVGDEVASVDAGFSDIGYLRASDGGAGDYRLFLTAEEGVLGLRDDGTLETVVDWKASDLQAMRVVPFADGTFLGMNGDMTAMHLTRKRADEIVEDTVLRIAVPGNDYDIRDFVQKYNRTHDGVRIETSVYETAADDPNAVDDALEKIKTDILLKNGESPDLVWMDGQHEQFLRMGSRGVFLDLSERLDGDAQMPALVDNVIDAMRHPNGALYTLTPGWRVETLAVKEKYGVPDNWTMDDMLALYDGAPDITYYWSTKDDMLRTLLTGTRFTDELAGTCSFDSPAFVQMLEFCDRWPSESTCPAKDYEDETRMREFENWHLEAFLRFRRDEDFLYPLTIGRIGQNSMASPFCYAKAELGGALTCPGYPSEDGQGGKVTAWGEMGIVSTCTEQDLAWDFLKSYVLESEVYAEPEPYPIVDAEFETALDDEMYIFGYNEESGGFGRTDTPFYDDDVDVYPLSQDERDALEAYLRGCRTYQMLDRDVETIVLEEAEVFFAGDRSAEDTAKAIQRRAELMLSEQSAS